MSDKLKSLPCAGCNNLNRDHGVPLELFVKDGWVEKDKENDKWVMVKHFPDCPLSDDAYPRTTGRQVVAINAENAVRVAKAIEAFWKKLAFWED
ncbi:MAG: hypothetical protein ACOC6Q_00485 [Patescibacteria group bacterium]